MESRRSSNITFHDCSRPYGMSMLTTSKSASCGVTQLLSSSGSEAIFGDTKTFPTQRCRNPKVIANCQVFSIRKTVPITLLMEPFPADRVTPYNSFIIPLRNIVNRRLSPRRQGSDKANTFVSVNDEAQRFIEAFDCERLQCELSIR
ncbi:unnamed protein product [Ceratitis capitata]|uniref:(Mediterranean fruit fly) hypothetical protein n=1 Tax=Ceratitis capitata TaxID=7213 RepID=A0A811UQZ5_CERCA|nr:unnamed protein product [Ceratitis capitata]